MLLDADEMGGPGGDAGRGGVAEAVEVDEVEPQVGLAGGVVVAALAPVFDRGEEPLAGSAVLAAVAQEAGLGDPDPDEDEGDGQAHQLPDQVQDVLVGLAVHLQPGDVVDRERLGAVVVDGVLDGTDEVLLAHALVGLAVEVAGSAGRSRSGWP